MKHVIPKSGLAARAVVARVVTARAVVVFAAAVVAVCAVATLVACSPQKPSTYPTEVTDRGDTTATSVTPGSGADTTDAPNQTGDGTTAVPYVPVDVPDNVHDDLLAAQGFTDTALMRHVYNTVKGNASVSPFSLYIPLAMLGNAASDSITDKYAYQLCYYNFDENSRNFGIAESNIYEKSQINRLTRSGDCVFTTANSLWISERLKNVSGDFKKTLRDDFGAEVFVRDLPASVGAVNKWASEHTNGKISEITNEIPSDTVAVVMNATYFKGKWRYEFDKALTRKDTFHNADGTTSETDFMESSAELFGYMNEGGIQGVELPYGGDGRFVMRLFTGDNLDAVNDYVARAGYIVNVSSEFTYHDDVTVIMPKFKVETTLNLLDTVGKIGFDFILGEGKFDKIDKGARISNIIQKVYVDVDEEGTEAAAVTTITMSDAVGEPPVRIKFDKPFVYGIYDMEDNLPLFYGVYRQAG
ncbi:serine/threonine protein kinase [Clostridia bacterium]|nr:serine/threonine protein kinase [Clostridia bacterium]